jgi:3-dehydro-L-gulonate 2-dehydrogenase
MKVDYKTLRERFSSMLVQVGFEPSRADILAEVFAETTFDGVYSHGINRFPRFLNDVRTGTVFPDAVPRLIQRSGATEQWDGQKGPGILNALHCTDRAIALAKESGIGCAGLRNTNHWMRGGTYGWRTADQGFMFLGWTNTIPNMPAWPGKRVSLGNNPLILAIPHHQGPMVLDMAMSQYSYGKLEWYKRNGKQLPEYGGYDTENRLTKDPAAILESERLLPIGLWKGSAFSLVLDLAAAILSGGSTSCRIGEGETETDLSQIFIAVDIQRFMEQEQMDKLIKETLQFNSGLNPGSRYPGQRSMQERKENVRQGIEVPDELWKEIGGS